MEHSHSNDGVMSVSEPTSGMNISSSSSSSGNPESRNGNNYVAMSDYRAALSGIENRLHDIGERLERDQGLASGTLFDATKESLVRNLTRIVQPLENDQYYQVQNQNKNDVEDDDGASSAQDDDNDDDLDDDDDNSPESNMTDPVIDEDDLIDTDAVLRVTKLRAEIRLASHQLALYRDSVTEKALRLADQEMRLAHAMSGVASDFQDEPQQQATSVTQLREDFAAVIQQKQQPSQEGEETTLADHLQQLTSNLNQLDLETPAQALQETLETVETTQQEPLSQTERAIRSRNNEGMHFSHRVIEDPVERLNLFLG
jgi:hypothetical protein